MMLEDFEKKKTLQPSPNCSGFLVFRQIATVLAIQSVPLQITSIHPQINMAYKV